MAFESSELGPEEFRDSQNYKNIAAAGIPLVIIEMPGDHGGAPSAAFEGDLLAFLNEKIDTIPEALGFYTFNENGEYVKIENSKEAIKIMRQNLISNNLISIETFTSEQINDMYEKYKKEFESYNIHLRETLDGINGMMNEFLATDAGFLADKIQALTSRINETKIKNLRITSNYASTTNSPKIQDVKIMEYVAKTSELLAKTLECVEFAMHAQMEREATENNIRDNAEDLAGGRSTTDAIVAGSIAGLGAAADALGYTGAKRQEYIDSETAKLYEKYFGEEANKEAESKGLSGEEKDKFVDDYVKERIEEFEKNKDKYDVDVETEVSETDLKGKEVETEEEKTNISNMSSTENKDNSSDESNTSGAVNKNIKYDDKKKSDNAKENSKLNNNTNNGNKEIRDNLNNSTNQDNNDVDKSNSSSTVEENKTDNGTNGSKDENTYTDNNQNGSSNIGDVNSSTNNGASYTSNGSSNSNSGYSPSTPSNSEIVDSGTIEPSNDTIEFPEYNSVISDNDADVYSSLDSSYKIIINHDENKVTSVEHYFDFGSFDKAISSLEKITQGYTSDIVESIKREGQYVKAIFKDSYFNTSSYTDFISKFDGFNKITK